MRASDTPRVALSAVATTKTVIVADDTAFVRDRFATALLGAGHTALTVKSAAELLAGPVVELYRLHAALAATQVAARRLPVTRAFHSSLLDPVLGEFAAAAAAVPSAPVT